MWTNFSCYGNRTITKTLYERVLESCTLVDITLNLWPVPKLSGECPLATSTLHPGARRPTNAEVVDLRHLWRHARIFNCGYISVTWFAWVCKMKALFTELFTTSIVKDSWNPGLSDDGMFWIRKDVTSQPHYGTFMNYTSLWQWNDSDIDYFLLHRKFCLWKQIAKAEWLSVFFKVQWNLMFKVYPGFKYGISQTNYDVMH